MSFDSPAGNQENVIILMSISDETVIDRAAVESVFERSNAMLRQSPAAKLPDTAAAERASQVRLALTRFRDSAKELLEKAPSIPLRPPAFENWTEVKLSEFLVQVEAMQQYVTTQTQAMTEIAKLVVELVPLSQVMIDELRSLFNRLETHRQAALEHEADRDIAAGRVRKFGNVDAALAFLKRQAS